MKGISTTSSTTGEPIEQRLGYYDEAFNKLTTPYWVDVHNYEDTEYTSGYQGIKWVIPSNLSSIRYLRLSTYYINPDAVLTVDEEISTSTDVKYSWTNTGHAFVESNYEDRILNLETSVADVKTQIEDIAEGVAPEYISQEADRVSQLILDNLSPSCICMVNLSDIHLSAGNGTEHALADTALAIQQIRKSVTLDLMVLHGDYVAGGSTSTIAGSKSELTTIRKQMYLPGLGLPQIWLQGNHDRNPYDTDDGDLSDQELYAYIFSHTQQTVVDPENLQRGYGYIDFPNQKIRVVYLNTSDISGADKISDHMISAEQLEWIADVAFKFDNKSDPQNWAIVTVSHAPLNWGGDMSCVSSLIDGFISGSSGTVSTSRGESVSYDFTNTDQGQFICSINGHTHNFRASRMGENSWWQIAIPQVCVGRYNEYGTSWPDVGGELDSSGNPVYYYKTLNSATSTSFCVTLIDRDSRKIHALHYGAGIDRVLDF